MAIRLDKDFMNEHGIRKKAMKVSWDEYIDKLEFERKKR